MLVSPFGTTRTFEILIRASETPNVDQSQMLAPKITKNSTLGLKFSF